MYYILNRYFHIFISKQTNLDTFTSTLILYLFIAGFRLLFVLVGQVQPVFELFICQWGWPYL